MTELEDQQENPKIICELIFPLVLDNSSEAKGRYDFYGKMGMVASCYDIYMASVVMSELQMMGYVVEMYPKVKGVTQ